MIRRPLILALGLATLLAGCAAPGGPHATAPASERPADLHEAGLGRVMGKTTAELVALLGEPDLTTHEGAAIRLQFVGPACVLDTYLYPARAGGEPVVSYIDARLPDGEDLDRASCVAALSRR